MSYIQIIRGFHSIPENESRTIRIYTPDAYDWERDRRFPVLYMFDGQNVFSHPESALFHTWCANTTMDRMVSENRIPPWIIVAVDHTNWRMEEYSPWDEPLRGEHGKGPVFADFLVNHLKPYIDTTYRTLPDARWTGAMGASMGGLISLFLGKRYPDIFGRIGAVSPSLMWSGGAMFRFWDKHTGHWSKIYLDTGSEEQYHFYETFLDYVRVTADFHNHMKNIGYGDHELLYRIWDGHFHNEESWQIRLPEIWQWLLEDAKG